MKDCPHCLDVWKLTTEQREELIEDLMALKDAVVRDVRSRSGVTRNGAELLQNGQDLTTKVGEQPWPQLMRYASIYCCMCGCIF